MRHLVLALITLYQRWLSPLKGFRCAHAAQHGGVSCSEAAKRLFAAHGLRHGWPLLRQRFRDCHDACKTLQTLAAEQKPPRRRELPACQEAFLDCGCTACMSPFF